MPNRIDWYVAELERHLRGRVDPSGIRELQQEVRSHLEQLSRTYQNQEAGDAQQRAIEEFGTPQSVARRYLRENPQPMNRGAVRLAKLAAFVCLSLPPLAVMLAPPDWGTWVLGVLGMALAAFLASCILVRRSLVLPLVGIALAILPVLALVFGFGWIRFQVDDSGGAFGWERRLGAMADVRAFPSVEARLKQQIIDLREGAQDFIEAKQPDDISAYFRSGTEFRVPSPISATWHHEVRWSTDWNFGRARRAWLKDGNTFAGLLSRDLDRERKRMAALQVGLNESMWKLFPAAIALAGGFIEIILVLLLALNFLGWLIGTIGSRLIPARRRTA